MRILIENSEYWLRNNGDLAMLDVTVERLRRRWPDARIGVLTDSPALLRSYFPTAEGITVFDETPWAPSTTLENVAARTHVRWVGPIALARLRSRGWLPDRARGALRRTKRHLFPRLPVAEDVRPVRPHTGSFRAAQEADLVIALGGGYLTDSDKPQVARVLALFEHAVAHHVPVVMLGQGLGPITDEQVLERCAAVLPHLQLVAVRERRRGPALLDRLGVAHDHVMVTGDDAIELAHNVGRDTLGTGLGVCLRVAGYNPVDPAIQAAVGRAVRDSAKRYEAPLIPLIIAEYRNQDRRSTLPLVRGAHGVVRPLPRYVSARAVARRVSDCRVLVTGAYHLAVFALSQGIPVVAITSSEYYEDKFLGLGDMFGTGLTHIRLDDPHLADRLPEAIEAAWNAAEEVREPLRTRAREQITSSRHAFDRVFDLLEQTPTDDHHLSQ